MKSDKPQEVNKANALKPVWIIDTTLRDGEQAPGVSFDRATKITIAQHLDRAGVNEIEAGIPAMGAAVQDEIRALTNLNLNCRLTSWCRALDSDLKLAARCNTNGVHISFPVSPILMRAMNKTPQWVLRQLVTLVKSSLHCFEMVSVGAQDTFRAHPGFLRKFVATAALCGAHRVRIADTVGLARPLQVADLIRELRRLSQAMALEFHAHNDLGMATANTIAAIEAGIEAVSVTVNGIGERAGNAALEQVSMAVKTLEDRSCSVDVRHLMGTCRLVSDATRRPIPVDQPITGEVVFHHESGIHCATLMKDPQTYQPFAPEILGREKERLVVGSHSGSALLKHLLQQSGLTIDSETAEHLLAHVRAEALKKQRTLSTPDLIKIYHATRLQRENTPRTT